jgi:hypothetical protein
MPLTTFISCDYMRARILAPNILTTPCSRNGTNNSYMLPLHKNAFCAPSWTSMVVTSYLNVLYIFFSYIIVMTRALQWHSFLYVLPRMTSNKAWSNGPHIWLTHIQPLPAEKNTILETHNKHNQYQKKAKSM